MSRFIGGCKIGIWIFVKACREQLFQTITPVTESAAPKRNVEIYETEPRHRGWFIVSSNPKGKIDKELEWLF